ncbi:ubiquinol-cytochrome C chaperone [Acetobacteraceae bacterium H6797]|nr:ubiquinol-cytochrome C chaperone [Acetobacteraceae bacterium H6797]
MTARHGEGERALFGLLRRKPLERTGFLLYGGAVAAARAPHLYDALGVPDTVPGRFELVGLHVALLIRRLRRDGEKGQALAQAVFDAMFADMDLNLREMGVGDLSVGKKVKAAWEAFHGRAHAYDAPLDRRDAQALAEALARNIWAETLTADAPGPQGLAQLALTADEALARLPLSHFLAGDAGFPAPV